MGDEMGDEMCIVNGVLLSLAHAYVCGDCAGGRGVGNMLWRRRLHLFSKGETRYHHPTAEYHAVKAHRLPPLNLTVCTSCVRCD